MDASGDSRQGLLRFTRQTGSTPCSIHWYNRGNDLRAAGDLAAAEQAFARAAEEFPGFAEAHASLGAAQQLRGAFAEAEASHRAAAHASRSLWGNWRRRHHDWATSTALSSVM